MFNGQSNYRFGVKEDVAEAPLAIGALLGAGAGAAGIGGLTVLSGAMLGASAGALLGGMFNQKTPKIQSASSQQQQANAQTPALPPATSMPATPSTPAGTPTDVNTGTTQDIPQIDRPQEPGEASPPTTDEVARGELEKRRKGRLSTILTTPRSRLDAGETEVGFEKLGG